jgi:hypothetical protein
MSTALAKTLGLSLLSLAGFSSAAMAEGIAPHPERAGRTGGDLDAGAWPAYAQAGTGAQIARWTSPSTIPQAIYLASRLTRVDYDYLLAQAELESAMDPGAAARTSSARGLYQFINSTWMATLQRHGARFGLGHYAQHIAQAPGGHSYVRDPGMRREILALRNDPEMAALMAAAFARDNREALSGALGRAPSHAELYLAHFLGASGAQKFLVALDRAPWSRASALFPAAARANRAIFHDRHGKARSLARVMSVIRGKYNRARDRVAYRFPIDRDYARQLDASLTPVAPPPVYLIVDEDVFALELASR